MPGGRTGEADLSSILLIAKRNVTIDKQEIKGDHGSCKLAFPGAGPVMNRYENTQLKVDKYIPMPASGLRRIHPH